MTNDSEPTEFEVMHDWLVKNAGFPSLQQFMANPDKYRNREDDIFVALANMEVWFKKRVKSVRYYWRGMYRCDTLERLEYVTQQEGFKGSQLDFAPRVKPSYGTSNHHLSKVDVEVDVYSKIEMKLMGGIVANG